MIKSFSDGTLKRLWEDDKTKGIDPKSLPKIRRLLTALNSICHPDEMDVPGYHYHALKGDLCRFVPRTQRLIEALEAAL